MIALVVLVVVAALLFWGGVFTVFFSTQGSSPLEFILGRYEPLPADLGKWVEFGVEEQTGLLREERLLLPDADSSGRDLVHQVRYRHPATRVIVRVEPERRIRRRRVDAR
jgi:hypothetical protein